MLDNRLATENSFSKPMAGFLVIGLIIGFSGFASAGMLKDVELENKVDRDGDGYVSSFEVKIRAHMGINERGNKGGRGLQATGEPFFTASYSVENYRGIMGLETEGEHNYRYDVEEKILRYSYVDVKNKISDPDYYSRRIGNIKRSIINGERGIERINVFYSELDGGSDKERISKWDHKIKNGKMYLEPPSKDRKEDVKITSNPSDATLYINGKKKGKTPWNGKMMVDIQERKGKVRMRLEKDGYHTKTVKVKASPSDNWDFDLKKVKKPVVIDSSPEAAEVRSDGQKIGETPLSKDYWVEDSFDIRVEKKGYETEEFNDVKAPFQKTVQMTSTTDNDDTAGMDSEISPDIYTNFNTISYYSDLATQLPGLQNMFHAGFNVSDRKVKTEESVRFDAEPSYSLINNISTYSWEFGDGETGSGKAVSHSFDNAGNYTVNLTIRDTKGSKVYDTMDVMVENRLPKPAFDVISKKIVTEQPVSFDSSRSKDADGKVVSYKWKMGDGSSYQRTDPELQHTYPAAGQYKVEMTAIDNQGEKMAVKKNIEVKKPNVEPQPSFTVSNSNPKTGEVIGLDASASIDPDGSINSFVWSMGDGRTKTGKKTQYNYSHPGTYKVELEVSDRRNLNAITSKNITVTGKAINKQRIKPKNNKSSPSKKSNLSGTRKENNSGNEASNNPPEKEENSIKLLLDLIQSLF
jgi:PKD repeat protein